MQRWLDVSGARIAGLGRLEREARVELAAAASRDLDAARMQVIRELALSLAILVVVTALALALRRSITRPLGEVSLGADMLSSGDLAFDVTYAGRDEIGGVATAFRQLRAMAERLAEEIRAMNVAVGDNRLEHRADVRAFKGAWAQLLVGMNDTMDAFSRLQQRRRKAERDAAQIFNLSVDLLAIAGTDGYFKRVNPAFERTLGYSAEELLSRPFLDFVHPDDRSRTRRALSVLGRGDVVIQFENRYVHRDGSIRWLQWNSQPLPEEGLVYAAARDVTESRRNGEEQAALRHVATLVAQRAAPDVLFRTVAENVAHLLAARSAQVVRHELDGSVTLLGCAPDGSAGEGGAAASLSAPIVVDDRVWGAIEATPAEAAPPPPDAEERLTRFTELVATAIADAASRAQLAASRARVVRAGDEARRRMERDLHDGAQMRLVHTILALQLARQALADSGRGGARARRGGARARRARQRGTAGARSRHASERPHARWARPGARDTRSPLAHSRDARGGHRRAAARAGRGDRVLRGLGSAHERGEALPRLVRERRRRRGRRSGADLDQRRRRRRRRRDARLGSRRHHGPRRGRGRNADHPESSRARAHVSRSSSRSTRTDRRSRTRSPAR